MCSKCIIFSQACLVGEIKEKKKKPKDPHVRPTTNVADIFLKCLSVSLPAGLSYSHCVYNYNAPSGSEPTADGLGATACRTYSDNKSRDRKYQQTPRVRDRKQRETKNGTQRDREQESPRCVYVHVSSAQSLLVATVVLLSTENVEKSVGRRFCCNPNP